MNRLLLMVAMLLWFFSSAGQASESLNLTVNIQEVASSGRDGEPLQYVIRLKQGNKVLVSIKREAEGNSLPSAQTFSTRYCGVPVQVVVLQSELFPSACRKVDSAGIGHGISWEFLIYKREGWVLMDELEQADTKDCATGKWITHDDGKRTIALLKSGQYPCRIAKMQAHEQAPVPPATADCSRAHTASEKAICANPKLQSLDRTLAQAYHQAFARTAPKSAERQSLIQDQRNWLKNRDRCQADVDCLSSAYRERIASLQAALPAKAQQVTP